MCRESKGVWNTTTCSCDPASSPVILDMAGNGYSLTDSDNGVEFDFDGDGWPEQTSWTRGDSDGAFLVLDRNGKGQIDNGGELFGDRTNQPACGERQGFHALASFDKPGLGGNQDGVVSPADEIFSRLRLWTDANHDGVSQAAESKTLAESGVAWIDLNAKEPRHRDRYGYQFRYRCKVQTSNGRRYAYGVFHNDSHRLSPTGRRPSRSGNSPRRCTGIAVTGETRSKSNRKGAEDGESCLGLGARRLGGSNSCRSTPSNVAIR